MYLIEILATTCIPYREIISKASIAWEVMKANFKRPYKSDPQCS